MDNKKQSNGGVGFFGLLTLALIVLKLIGKIAWSWFWVLSPLWLSALAAILCGVIVGLFDDRLQKKEMEKLLKKVKKNDIP